MPPLQQERNTASLTCTHPRLLPGLDHAYCPDCKGSFNPKKVEYQSTLDTSHPNQSYVTNSEPTTAQLLHKISSHPNQSYVTTSPDLVSELLHKISALTLDQLCTLRDRLNRLIAEKEELENWSVPTKPGREVVKVARVGSTCYQLESVKCGKPNCKCSAGAAHGPYWYAYERRGNKVKSKYLGKNFKL